MLGNLGSNLGAMLKQSFIAVVLLLSNVLPQLFAVGRLSSGYLTRLLGLSQKDSILELAIGSKFHNRLIAAIVD